MDTGRRTVPPLMRLLDGFMRGIEEKAGIPYQPEEVPGVSITFTLEVKIIGRNQRVDLSFEIVKIGWYEIYEDKEIETLYREFIERIGPELTHNSEEWACWECCRPATDISWLSLYRSGEKIYNRCTIIIGPACETCAPKLQKSTLKFVQDENNRNTDDSSTILGTILKPNGISKLSGSCLGCREEQPADPEYTKPLARCSKCKLVRYCSVACQKNDWARHKPICRKVLSVSSTGASGEEKSPEMSYDTSSMRITVAPEKRVRKRREGDEAR
ncbi:hypothetical protein DFH09DRAFT_1272764 [Mycena vulgaris]|nr:hypothetical protein DFH09DRAFT_1272764 [Mycena vulgaris]